MKNILQNRAHRKLFNQLFDTQTLKRILLGITAACLLSTIPAHAAPNNVAEKPLQFGVMPFLSAAMIVRKFEPLISYLETTLNRPVSLKSAPSFKAYIENAINGDYDLFLAAPHITAYMEKNYQSRRVSRFKRTLKGYYVVHADSTYQSLEDLRGKRFATADPLAVITILAEIGLIDFGIDPDKEMVRHYSSHNNAMQLVAQGEQDVAAVGITIFDNIKAHIKDRLRVLAKTEGIPHLMFQTRHDLPDSEHQAIADAMLKFTASAAGKEFFNKAAFGDMAPITDNDIDKVAFMIPILEQKISR